MRTKILIVLLLLVTMSGCSNPLGPIKGIKISPVFNYERDLHVYDTTGECPEGDDIVESGGE